MGSLSWASGLIPLGRLYLRPLQRHSLGLTDRFTPPHHVDQIHWSLPAFYGTGKTYVFLPQESLSALFRQISRFLRTLPLRGGALTWGIPRLRVPGPVHTASSISISGVQGGSLCPTALGSIAPGPPGYDRYGQFDSSFVYQQARRDPFTTLLRLTVELLW